MTSRYHILTFGLTLVALACTSCGEETPHGAAAMEKACDGVLDAATIKEAKGSTLFERVYDDTASGDSPGSAAKALLSDDRAAYVCQLAFADMPDSGKDALWIKFTPGEAPLFPEKENRSFGSYKAYKLGSGMQGTTESGRGDVYFLCHPQEGDAPLSVTASLYNDLEFSTETRFRILFQSSKKMASLLNCKNEIQFPSPETLRPLPLEKD